MEGPSWKNQCALCCDCRTEGAWPRSAASSASLALPSVSHLCRALETFNALDIQFVSLCEQVDTNTPTGKLVFTILGAVAEGERNLIAERVRAGLRNAKAKGKRLGRPTKCVDVDRITSLRASGHSWRSIAGMMKLSVGTVYAAARTQGTDHAKAVCA
jgi:DNA invertase Pin-like site-specific DNA recombinase